MLHFRIYVKYVNQRCDLYVIEFGDCSIISIINVAKNELFGCHLKDCEEVDEMFKVFDERNFLSIEFELEAMTIAIEFPDEPLGYFDTDFQLDNVSSEDSYVSLLDDDVNGDHPIE
ncbi:hypothetical protein ACOSP7_019377 [Xanthoceras sorbifolium]